jgi:hypothetical protein
MLPDNKEILVSGGLGSLAKNTFGMLPLINPRLGRLVFGVQNDLKRDNPLENAPQKNHTQQLFFNDPFRSSNTCFTGALR